MAGAPQIASVCIFLIFVTYASAAGNKCAKCNIPEWQGGCKCDNNCDCKKPPTATAGNKCAKCNIPEWQGGCKCDNNCDCKKPPTATGGCPGSQDQAASTPERKNCPIRGFGTFFDDPETLCLGSGRLPQGVYGVALNGNTGMRTNGYDPRFCGQCIQITGPRGTIKAKVIDVCDPSNCDFQDKVHIDIFKQSVYAKVADPNEGVVKMTWQYVQC